MKAVENGMVLCAEPKYRAWPTCPECGRECETYYFDKYGDIIGCDNCISFGDAIEYQNEEDENAEWLECDRGFEDAYDR